MLPQCIIKICLVFIITEVTGQKVITITPNPSTTIKEYDNLTLTCKYSNNGDCPNDILMEWKLNNAVVLSLGWNGTQCVWFSGIFQYSCRKFENKCEMVVSLGQVTRLQHGDKWECVGEAQISPGITISVNVPITSVTMTSPTSTEVTVSENVPSKFVCETSAGRPQAAFSWAKQLNSEPAVTLGAGSIQTITSGKLLISISTLQFVPNRNDHNYRIYCATNNIGPNNTFVSARRPKLDVQYAPASGPDIGNTDGRNFLILDGKPQTLTCSIQGGRPLASLSWNCFNGTVQDKSSGITVAEEISWTAFRSHDKQHCICRSTHPVENQTVYVVIKALYPPETPTFSVNGQSVSGTVSVIENKSVSISCNSSGSPLPTYEWTPRGSPGSAVLTLSSVQSSDSAEFTCIATNIMVPSQGNSENGRKTESINLNVLFPPRSPVLTFDNTNKPVITTTFNVVRGDTFSIYCDAEGNPTPLFQWSGQSDNNKKLTVTNVQTDGSWTCQATNEMVSTGAATETGVNTALASVNVLFGPSAPNILYHYNKSGSVTLGNGLLSVIKGKNFNVICDGSVSRPPVSAYRWNGFFSSQTGTLTISNIGVTDDGKIATCTASNSMERTYGAPKTGITRKEITIQVLYAPEVLSLFNDTAVENTTYRKTCVATPGNPANTVYKWTSDVDSAATEGPFLTISKITKSSAGTYRCTAKNTMKPTGENAIEGSNWKEFILTVHYPASIKAFTVNSQPGEGPYTYDENSTITIKCEVDSNPASRISIIRDGTALARPENVKEAEHRITKASYSDAGLYSCKAANQYNGQDSPTVERRVFVRCPPRAFNLANNVTHYHILKDNVTMSLNYTAYPDPTGHGWYKLLSDSSWENLSSGISFNNHQTTLTIHNIKADDFGQYEVRIVNPMGNLSHTYFIAAQDKPQVPTQITTTTIAHNSAVIQWLKGFNGGQVQTFYIEYWSSHHTALSIEQRDDTEEIALNATLHNLKPKTEYTVQIFAGNSIGNSSKSENITFTTKEQPKDDPESDGFGTVIGAAAGASAAVIVIVIVLIVVICRRKQSFRGKAKKEDGLSDKMHGGAEENDEDVQTENVNYISADDCVRQNETTMAASGDTYATVNKPKTQPTEIYAQVNKKKTEDLYAMPQKNKGGVKDGKKTPAGKKAKGVKAKPDAKEKAKKVKAKPTTGDVYENHQLDQIDQGVYENSNNVNSTQTGYNDKLYEDVGASGPQQFQRETNKDGLIYLQLDFKNAPKQAENKIIGSEETTEYGVIDFKKKAAPLPDSDEEDKQ